YVRFENKCLESLYEKGHLVEKLELEQRLAYVFAESLKKWREDHGDQRFVFLIDEYERALEYGGAGGQHAENRFDAMMRDAIASCQASLFIIFSREMLYWDQKWPTEWRE